MVNKFILIGLGNPGKQYENTRHNAGKMLAGWMKEEGKRKKEEGKLELIESESFMNESGGWLVEWLRKDEGRRKKDEGHQNFSSLLPSAFYLFPLFVAHDDLDIPLGKFKIQFGKGPRLHKGILSIEQALGTKEFWRIRIGIDAREEGRRKKEEGRSGEEYVLSNFKREERKLLETEVFSKIGEELENRLTE